MGAAVIPGGRFHEDFRRVADVFARQLARTGGGASVAVFHRGELVVDLWGGRRDEGAPWRRDTLAMCFSTTKGVVATAAHVLADRGLIDYDERVAAYWPEFAQNGKAAITVRHLLSHSAGLHRLGTIIDHANRMLDWEHMAEALAEARPAYPPGQHVGYHGLTFGWLVGQIVRRVTGTSLNQFVQDSLAGPLGVDGLFIGCPPEQRHRAADLQPALPVRVPLHVGRALDRTIETLSAGRVKVNLRRIKNTLLPRGFEELVLTPEVMDAEIPAMNGHFDAVSLASMYAMLARGGLFRGARLLSPHTIARATAVQNNQMDHVVVVNMQWRLGYHRVPILDRRLPRVFGHLGFGGSGAWADPEHDLSLAMVCNRGGGTPIGDKRILDLSLAAARAVTQPRRVWSIPSCVRRAARRHRVPPDPQALW